MSEETGFLKGLDDGDESARAVWADWLEERGDPRFEAVRALVRMGRRPHQTVHRGVTAWGFHNGNGTEWVSKEALLNDPRSLIVATGTDSPRPGYYEIAAPDWSKLPGPWFLACWSPEKADSEEVLAPWIMADTRSRAELVAIDGFLALPRHLQLEYLTGVSPRVVECHGNPGETLSGCPKCFNTARILAPDEG